MCDMDSRKLAAKFGYWRLRNVGVLPTHVARVQELEPKVDLEDG